MPLLKKINDASDREGVRKAWLGLAVTVFLVLIAIPSVFVITKVVTDWDLVSGTFADSATMAQIYGATWNSFSIALIVTVIDIVLGIPMAWLLIRKEIRGKRFLDTLMDMPLAFPTAVIGISVVLFWGAPDGVGIPGLGLVVSPYVMVLLLHIIFTYPYMVRSLSAILEQIDPTYETAAMTLGASRFTAVRTVTLPLFRTGLVTGFILCFARSLSETGGTYIALTMMGEGSIFFTGPSFIADKALEATDAAMGPMIVISIIMILIALALLLVVRRLMVRIRLPMDRVWPQIGRRLSKGVPPKLKDALTLLFAVIVVLLPSFYIFAFLTQPIAAVDYGMLMYSIGLSFLVAGTAVVFNIIFGIPLALHIARNSGTRTGRILDSLVNLPLLIPTTALGFSLALFWGGMGAEGAFAVVLVILGHIAFTYPLVVRNIIGAVEEVGTSHEEVAMTLGAKPLQAFSKVLAPIIKSSIIAGAILAFTRSLGEVGASLAINPDVMTVPIYINSLIKNQAYSEAAICSIVLICICFVFMLMVRVLTSRRRADA